METSWHNTNSPGETSFQHQEAFHTNFTFPTLANLAEDFKDEKRIAPAVLKIIDPSQFGSIPRSSTTHVLISMVHSWAKATDWTGSAVRVALLGYCKAFHLIDHHILAKKVSLLSMPLCQALGDQPSH